MLEAAGRSLLNKAGGGSTLNYKSGGSSILSGGATSGGLSFGLVSSKISFGLYGGHLPVDHGSYTKPKDEDNSDSRSDSSTRYILYIAYCVDFSELFSSNKLVSIMNFLFLFTAETKTQRNPAIIVILKRVKVYLDKKCFQIGAVSSSKRT